MDSCSLSSCLNSASSSVEGAEDTRLLSVTSSFSFISACSAASSFFLRSSICSLYCIISTLSLSAFLLVLFEIFLALEANFMVLLVSSKFVDDGVAVAMIAILEFPLRDGSRIRVNLESRYGRCPIFSPFFRSESFEMMVPNVSKLLLMKAPSLLRNRFSDATFSEPAKSINVKADTRMFFLFVSPSELLSIIILKTVWDRDDMRL
mmetsp:Transcript_28185/g.39791  ORF Transcript_28185/g.39791 Transcript_28185/m.39791 type:complete len:206 (-) Transcript_28185:845-1462(-)